MIVETIGNGDEQIGVSKSITTSLALTIEVGWVNGWHWLEVDGKCSTTIERWGAHDNTILGTIWNGIGEWHTREGGLDGSTSRRTIVSLETKGGGWEVDVGSTHLVFRD